MGSEPVCRSPVSNNHIFYTGKFALHVLRAPVKGVFFQAQYSYTVIESLMAHLDENSKSSPVIRTNIADVLSKIIAIAAGESVGKRFIYINLFFN